MAIQQFSKTDKGVASGPQPLGTNLLRAALLKINTDGTIVSNTTTSRFLLNPSTWEETKSSVWIPQPIPGQSDPVFQWSHGGPRVVTFTALVTRDTSYLNIQKSQSGYKLDVSQSAVSSAVGLIGAALAQISPKKAMPPGPPPTTGGYLNISDYLNYYRSCQYPLYDDANNPQKLIASPPLLALLVGDTINSEVIHGKIGTQTPIWILTDLHIRITKQMPNLSPMEAEVEFQLTQYNIRSTSETSISPNSRTS